MAQGPLWQSRLRQRLVRIAGPYAAFWSRQAEPVRALPGFLWAAILRYFQNGALRASALAYYAVFSLFPLTLLIAVGISRLLGPALAEQQISLALSSLLPPNTTEALVSVQSNVQQALEQSGSFTLIALAGLLWSGLGLFTGISNALDQIFDAPARSIWRQRLVALVMAFALLGLLALSFLSSAVIRLIGVFIFDPSNFWINLGAYALPVGLNLLIFGLLFKFVPARRVHWDAVWPAALIGALAWELAKAAFGWYLANVANYQFVYGTLATGIILLFWAFLIATIFLVCAEFCAALNAWYILYFVTPPDERDDSPAIDLSPVSKLPERSRAP
jgi:membrane protein